MVANQRGGWDAALDLLLAMMAADYITGVLVAAFWKISNKSEVGTLSGKAGFRATNLFICLTFGDHLLKQFVELTWLVPFFCSSNRPQEVTGFGREG